MTDFGFSIVIGHPLPFAFMDWVVRDLYPLPSVSWNDVETLHGTLVNSTAPIARSVGSEDEVLSFKAMFHQKCETSLVTLLKDFDPFEVKFHPVKQAGGSIVLQAENHDQLGALKRALQGGQPWISEGEAAVQLFSLRVIGIDKRSTKMEGLQPTVAVTLGTKSEASADPKPDRSAPNVHVRGARLAFYRDRSLLHATLSETLEFGRHRTTEYANMRKISRFFDELP